jgi:predicted DNA-binding WGR domain protein
VAGLAARATHPEQGEGESMSDEQNAQAVPASESAAQPPAPRTEFAFAYAGPSGLVAEEGRARVALFGNTLRPPVRADGAIRDPILLRESLSALYEVVGSDYRYVPKDRTAYLAYQRMRKQSASLDQWQAQRAYAEWMMRNDPLAFLILDPVVTVHPDEMIFEVFSKDEGSYAKLGVDWSAFDLDGAPQCGTTNIDFSRSLYDGVQRMRSYRDTRLVIGTDAVALKTGERPEVLEKKISVPDSWLRGFLQVQSASTLPSTSFTLAPIDLYNVLRHLRLNADRKKGGRGVRVELVPGEPPRLVLEPWDLVLSTHGAPYTGRTAQMIRVWGRRRLMMLRRLLPFAERIDVTLLGTGLPSFTVLRAGPVTFTLGLTGFTSANWAQAVSFDVLLPRPVSRASEIEAVVGHLRQRWCASAKAIAADLGLKMPVVLEALQLCCQQGMLMYDLARDVYRLRPLTDAPLDLPRLEFRDGREREAHDLIVAKGAVRLVTENRVFGVGLELTGKVSVEAEKREFRPQLMIDDDGRVKQAECTCNFFRKHGLKEGPCVHLVALRMLQAREELKRRQGVAEARTAVVVETRTYTRRHERGEDIHQVSLDRRRLKLRWGRRGETLRVQSLSFPNVEQAREAYFSRVEKLEARGYLDVTAG